MTDQPTTPPKRENIWLNIGLNVLIPSLLLTKGQGWLEKFGARMPWLENLLGKLEEMGLEAPAVVLIIALAFPILYGLYDFAIRRKWNFFSILGFVSVLISGGIGLFEIDKDWVAVKEALIPFLFAIAVIVSLKTPFPLVRTFLFSPELFDVPKIETALAEKDKKQPFERLMTRCTMMLSGSFLLSAVLNYFLARYFMQSETGTPEFTVELGKMNFWSWPVITLPSMIIMFYILNQLLNGIHAYTGYDVEDVLLVGQPKGDPKKTETSADATTAAETSDASANETTGDDDPTDTSAPST